MKFVFRDPCKKCIVAPMCREECMDKYNHNLSTPFLDLLVFFAKAFFIVCVIFCLNLTVSIFIDSTIYNVFHWTIGTIIGGYIMWHDIAKEYKEDRKRIFGEE